MKIIILILVSLVLFSCSKTKSSKSVKLNIAEQKLYDDIREYQYHEKDVKDFSFLTKYKNLEALDLSGTNVKDISFIKDLKKLRILILENTSIELEEVNKYVKEFDSDFGKAFIYKKETNTRQILKYYSDLYFSHPYKIFHSVFHGNRIDIFNAGAFHNDVYELDLFKKAYYYNYKSYRFSDLYGLERFKNLNLLKIILKDSKYIDKLTKLEKLEELHLAGSVAKLPEFQDSLKKLYLYNIDIDDYSFLKNSKIKELYIVTQDYKHETLKSLEKEFPNIYIEVKNKLHSPILKTFKGFNSCNSYNNYYKVGTKDNVFYTFNFDNISLEGNCDVIEELRDDIFDIKITLNNFWFLNYNLGIDINHLWNDDETFLDIALKQKNVEVIEKLIAKHNYSHLPFLVKRGCEVLKTKCKAIPKDLQELFDKREK